MHTKVYRVMTVLAEGTHDISAGFLVKQPQDDVFTQVYLTLDAPEKVFENVGRKCMSAIFKKVHEKEKLPPQLQNADKVFNKVVPINELTKGVIKE